LAGTPASGTAGAYHLTITANNGLEPNATQDFTLTVNQAPLFTSADHTTFTVGKSSSFNITTSGSPTPAITFTGDLPSGVTLTDNDDGTATLAGVPAVGTKGEYDLVITASNGGLPNATQDFTLTVNQAPVFTSQDHTTFKTGEAGSFTITTSGDPTPDLTKTGTLPTGLTFTDNDDGTATLAGTPASGTAGAYHLTITANNGLEPNATQDFSLMVETVEVISEDGGEIETYDEEFTITVPGQAVDSETEFDFTPQVTTTHETGSMNFVGINFQLNASAVSTGESVTAFAKPITVKIKYDEADLGSTREQNLYLFYWDEDAEAWVDVVTTCPGGEYIRNMEENWFSVDICHLSDFAVAKKYELMIPLVIR
jgi:hypothetical protein